MCVANPWKTDEMKEVWKTESTVLLSNPETKVNYNMEAPKLQILQPENSEKHQQNCHVCNRFFENLEEHYASSHMKEENNKNDVQNKSLEYKTFESENIKAEIKQEFEIKQENHTESIPISIMKFACSVCYKSFDTTTDLKEHYEKNHEANFHC